MTDDKVKEALIYVQSKLAQSENRDKLWTEVLTRHLLAIFLDHGKLSADLEREKAISAERWVAKQELLVEVAALKTGWATHWKRMYETTAKAVDRHHANTQAVEAKLTTLVKWLYLRADTAPYGVGAREIRKQLVALATSTTPTSAPVEDDSYAADEAFMSLDDARNLQRECNKYPGRHVKDFRRAVIAALSLSIVEPRYHPRSGEEARLLHLEPWRTVEVLRDADAYLSTVGSVNGQMSEPAILVQRLRSRLIRLTRQGR